MSSSRDAFQPDGRRTHNPASRSISPGSHRSSGERSRERGTDGREPQSELERMIRRELRKSSSTFDSGAGTRNSVVSGHPPFYLEEALLPKKPRPMAAQSLPAPVRLEDLPQQTPAPNRPLPPLPAPKRPLPPIPHGRGSTAPPAPGTSGLRSPRRRSVTRQSPSNHRNSDSDDDDDRETEFGDLSGDEIGKSNIRSPDWGTLKEPTHPGEVQTKNPTHLGHRRNKAVGAVPLLPQPIPRGAIEAADWSERNRRHLNRDFSLTRSRRTTGASRFRQAGYQLMVELADASSDTDNE